MKRNLGGRLFSRPIEGAFLLLYSAFFWCYNDPEGALSGYPRFMFSVLPVLFWAVEPYLPENLSLVAALAFIFQKWIRRPLLHSAPPNDIPAIVVCAF
jgi:hypothetical protein